MRDTYTIADPYLFMFEQCLEDDGVDPSFFFFFNEPGPPRYLPSSPPRRSPDPPRPLFAAPAAPGAPPPPPSPPPGPGPPPATATPSPHRRGPYPTAACSARLRSGRGSQTGR